MIRQGPTPKKKQVIKNGRSENNPRHKKPKVHDRTYRPISKSRQMYKQQAKKVKHAQDPGTTNLSPANIRSGGSWVRGKRRHGLAMWRRKKPILGFLLKLFWGKCPAGITCHPKEVRMSWNHQVHAIRDRERGHTHCNRQKSHSKQTNKIAFFVWQKGAAQPVQVSGGG